MREPKHSFRKFGDEFIRVYCSGDNRYAIYSRGEGHYELMILRERKKDAYIGKKLVSSKGDIVYPSNEDWGKYAWTYTKIEDAYAKIDALKASRGNNERMD